MINFKFLIFELWILNEEKWKWFLVEQWIIKQNIRIWNKIKKDD